MTLCDRLRHAITTASNDDYSEAGSDKRKRHTDRLDAMAEAIAEIERLRSVIRDVWECLDQIGREPDVVGAIMRLRPVIGQPPRCDVCGDDPVECAKVPGHHCEER